MSEQQYSNEGRGALWLKKSKTSDVTYLGGSLEINGEKIFIKVFKNTYKVEGDNLPDYTIKVDEPRVEEAQNPDLLKKAAVKAVGDGDLPF